MKKLLFISLIAFGLTGCTSNKYRDQLEYYQSTIGNKCMYYLSTDKKLDNDTREFYYNINKETTKLLTESGGINE